MVTQSLILLILIFSSATCFAAACCGGASSMPSTIIGDNRAQFSSFYSNSAVTYYSDEYARFSSNENKLREVNETLNLSGAYLLSNYWQISSKLSVLKNTKRTTNVRESTSGLGQAQLQMSYEFLPELFYSVWKPRGFIYLGLSAPLSRSTYDAIKPLRTDSLSNGHYQFNVGVIFTKTIGVYDALIFSSLAKGLTRNFDTGVESIRVDPGLISSSGINLGVSPYQSPLRLGVQFSHLQAFESKVEATGISSSESRYLSSIGTSVSYRFEEFSVNLTYTDEIFLGNAKNTPLSQSLSAGLVYFVGL